MNNDVKPRLGDILVARGLAPRAGVEAALQTRGGRLASEMFRLGVASERALALGLAEQRGHPAVVLSESSLDLAGLELVPRAIAEEHGFLPVEIDSDSITLAVADVPEPGAARPPIFDQIEFATGRRVALLLAVKALLAEAVAAAYDARKRGETTLMGTSPRPPGVPEHAPLSLARPPSQGVVTDLLSAPTAPPDNVPTPPIAAPPGKPQVLVIDDEEDIRTLLRKMLAYDGYDVVEAGTGREALEVLRTLRPAVILLDAMLPEIHGFDICATLKRSEVFASTPVVIISALYKGWEHARTAQETHGADAFVEKPFDVHYVRQLVARLMGKELPRNELSAEWRRKVKALRDEAEAAYRMNDLAGCEVAVKKWRALDPFDAHAWLYVGNARMKHGDQDGAMKAWERAATFDGTLFSAFKNLAVVYEQLGFTQRGLMAWYRAHELAPDGETRLQIEARLARQQGSSG